MVALTQPLLKVEIEGEHKRCTCCGKQGKPLTLPLTHEIIQQVLIHEPEILERKNQQLDLKVHADIDTYKRKMFLTAELMKHYYVTALRDGKQPSGCCKRLAHTIKRLCRMYWRKDELVASLQQAELIQAQTTSAQNVRRLLNGWQMFVQNSAEAQRFHFVESPVSTASEKAAIELLKLYAAMCLLLVPIRETPTFQLGGSQNEMGVDRTLDDGSWEKHVAKIMSKENEIFGVSFETIRADSFPNEINYYLKAFDNSSDNVFGDMWVRMLNLYQDMLTCIITELRIQVNTGTGIQNKVVSGISTLFFTGISWAFHHYYAQQYAFKPEDWTFWKNITNWTLW